MTKALSQKLMEFKGVAHNTEPDDYVFCNADGTPLGNTWWLKNFDGTLKRLGIDKKGRNLKPHSFRHTLNTFLIGKGEDPMLVRQLTGWRNVSTQLRYTHLQAEHLQSSVDKIDTIWDSDDENE